MYKDVFLSFKDFHLEPLLKLRTDFTHRCHLVKTELFCKTIKIPPLTKDHYITHRFMVIIKLEEPQGTYQEKNNGNADGSIATVYIKSGIKRGNKNRFKYRL